MFLKADFKIKDFGPLKYFFDIEVACSSKGIFLCPRKHALDVFKECGLTWAKPSIMLIEQQHKFSNEDGDLFDEPRRYKPLVGRLLEDC